MTPTFHRDHLTQGDNRLGYLPPAQFLLKATRVVSRLKGLRPNPKKHLHFASN
jgi:hypothetical protein